MKTLHTSVNIERAKLSTSPFLVVEIQYDAVIGTKYYSEQVLVSPATELDLLINASSISQEINEDKGSCQGVTIDISDVSKTILGYLRQAEIYKKVVIIWQCFESVEWANQTKIWQGTVKTASRKETGESVSFSCESYQANQDGKLGTNTTESTAKKEGEVLPLVFGFVKRSKCVQIIESLRTSLVVPLSVNGSIAIVSDSREFVQNTWQYLWVGQELTRGKFEGCKLTFAQRACIVATGYTTWNQPNYLTFRANLTPQGHSWIGYTVKFFVGQTTFERVITNFTSPDVYGFKKAAVVQSNVYFEIYTPASQHDVGEEVYEKLDEYKWVANDAVSQNVEYIEILGSISMEGENTSSKMKEVETYVRLDDRYMTVNLNDGGKTTITLPFDPKHLRNQPYKNTDLLATMTGINYSNAVDIIVYLAQLFGLAYPGDFDVVSEASEKAKISWLKMGLTITERLVFEVIFDIAFQARLSIKFINNKLTFKYLQNKAGTSVKTISDADRVYDSLEITQDEVVANKLEVSYSKDDLRFEISDSDSISAYGEKTKSLQLWAIQEKVYAEGIAYFWLRRWAWPLEKAKLGTFLNSLELELNDWVTLESTGNYTSQPAEIVRSEQQPSGGEIDKINYDMRLPRWAGCASSCEQYEETGCSSTCEQYCTSSAQTACGYACETSDQTACSLTCVSTCMLECTTYYQMQGDDTTCKSQCQTSCTSAGVQTNGCNSGCQQGCQSGCTTGEQSGCHTSCEIQCEVACETGGQACSGECESNCQIGCQTGAETNCTSSSEVCSTACQGGCQTGDTTSPCGGGCQTGVEACASSCRACCQGVCTSSYEGACSANGTCQSSCTADIQAISFTSCSKSCESSCRGNCEGNCQSCCRVDGTETTPYQCLSQCQTACINVCQTSTQTFSGGGDSGCSTQCEAYCMTSTAQTGCSLYCTIGCMCDCEATCESGACRSGCEITCTCSCQTAAMSAACSSGTEGVCYTACQAYVETNCVTGCESGCQAFCRANSQGYSFCFTGCECNCQGTCECDCRTASCETTCTCTCQTSAQTANLCATAAQGGDVCFTSCQDFCRTNSQTSGCKTGCQTFCMTGGGVQAGCTGLYCTTGCQCGCEQACQDFCRSTASETQCTCACQSSLQVDFCNAGGCMGSCMTGAEYLNCRTTCQLVGCTVSCQDFCRTTNQTSGCTQGCQTFCMTGGGCQAGCQLYCTTGCQCNCMAACQSYCRDGCEQACTCACQTAAQT